MTDRVLITGASAGIGRALALHYATRGARLILVGRSEPRLQAVAKACQSSGAGETVWKAIDVRDRIGFARFTLSQDDLIPIDVVIANAGITNGRPEHCDLELAEGSVPLLETNVIGVVNTIEPLLPRMIARRCGQIGIIGSIAGLIPLPDSPSYCASKAAVSSYGQALRGLLREHSVGVSVISAGYVDTAMSQRVSGWKPGMMSSERAAQTIAKALENNRANVAFPRTLAALARIGAVLPEPVRARFISVFRFSVAPPPTAEQADPATKT